MIQWIIAIGGFILFWLLRAWYYYNKERKISELKEEYIKYVAGEQNLFIRNKLVVSDLFNQANVPNFATPYIERVSIQEGLRHELDGFKNLHLLREDVITTVGLKFEEAIGNFQRQKKQSLNPFFWVESIIFLPKNLIEYIAPNSSGGGFTKVFQLIFWIAMILFGLDNVQIIDISKWF